MEAPSTFSVILTEALFLLLTLPRPLRYIIILVRNSINFLLSFIFPTSHIYCYVILLPVYLILEILKLLLITFVTYCLFKRSIFQSPCFYSSFTFSCCLFLLLFHCYLFLCIYMAEHLFSHKWKNLYHFCKMNGDHHIKINKPTMVS